MLGCLRDCHGSGPARAGLRVSSTVRRAGHAHLILLLEAIALGCLHLVDVLQKISHADRRVELPCVIRGALPTARAPRRTPQEAAGLSDTTASLISCRKGKGLSHRCILRLEAPTAREHNQDGGWLGHSSESSLARPPDEHLQVFPFCILGFPSTK